MEKITRTTYILDNQNGTTVTLHLEDDHLIIRNIWANEELDSEVSIYASVKNLGDLAQALNEMHNEVIGE